MLIQSRAVRIQLFKGDHLRLDDARGARLSAISGTAWITVDRDSSDILVPAGESFLVASDRSVLIGPLFEAATLDLQGTQRTFASALTRQGYPVSNLDIG